jgi:PleD family two-component response regulator
MMPGTSLATATDMAERVQSAIAASTIETIGPRLRFAIRLGLAAAESGDDVQTLVRRAGAVMPRAKNEPVAESHASQLV